MSSNVLIVGSKALEYAGLNRASPNDLDVWYYGVTPCLKGDLHEIPLDIINKVPLIEGTRYATPDAVYTIKCSHFSWDIHWNKTKMDILHLRNKGCVLLPDLYRDLKKFWSLEHGDKSFLSLNSNKNKFFEDRVKYIYDHDLLHTYASYPEDPVYKLILLKDEEVMLDENKFNLLPHSSKVNLFREEISVIAFEKWLVHNPDMSWVVAYNLSLKKVITNLTKNWANDFIVQNLVDFTTPSVKEFINLNNNVKTEDRFMSEVNLELFKEIAEELGESTERVVYEMCEGDFDYNDEVAERVNYEHLEQDGGGEGGSEYCYGVFKLKNKTYKAEYSYYSYNGHEYDYILSTLKEVNPVKKTVTVYQ